MTIFSTIGFWYVVFATTAFTVIIIALAFKGYKQLIEDAGMGRDQQKQDATHGAFHRLSAMKDRMDVLRQVDQP